MLHDALNMTNPTEILLGLCAVLLAMLLVIAAMLLRSLRQIARVVDAGAFPVKVMPPRSNQG
jgi:hypothetical protein